jgi:hypothetical protein
MSLPRSARFSTLVFPDHSYRGKHELSTDIGRRSETTHPKWVYRLRYPTQRAGAVGGYRVITQPKSCSPKRLEVNNTWSVASTAATR